MPIKKPIYTSVIDIFFLSAKPQENLRMISLTTLVVSMWLTACGGASVPSPELYKQLSIKPNELHQGKMDLSDLTPTSSFEDEFQNASLGRSVKLSTENTGKNTLEAPTPCSSLLPDRVRDDYRDRLSTVFDSYILQSIKSNTKEIEFSSIGYRKAVPEQTKEWTIVSGHVGISRILSYVNDDELKYYDRCCRLTGSCGTKMINKLYEVSEDIRFLDRKDPHLQKSLLSFEAKANGKFTSKSMKKLAKKVHRDLVKAVPTKPQVRISHITYREIPKPAPSPYDKLNLKVVPSSKIVCKKKKSKAANVVEFNLEIENTEGAQATFGYEITTSKKWVDLSLAERKRLVKVGTGSIACYPGPDAFTNPDDRCPAKLVLTAFPPTCASIKSSVDFTWDVQVGIYAPGDRERKVFHAQKSNVVSTTVHKK